MLIIISFSFITRAGNNHLILKNETDSLKSILSKCKTDTCKFDILSGLFWKKATTDLEPVKYIGQWAFQIIKNSQNPRALSDGYDIKAFLLQEEEKFDSAYYCFDKALKISKSIDYKFRMAWSYYHLGDLKATFNNQEGAIKDMKSAIQNFSAIKNTDMVLASTWYIAYFYQTVNYDSAMAYYEKRLELFKKYPDKNMEIFLCLEIALFYKSHNNIPKFLELLNRTLEIAEKIDNDKELGNIYVTIGDFFFENKKRISNVALDYYKKAFAISEKTKDTLQIARIYDRIGNFYLKEGKDSMALTYQLISLGISKKLKNQRRTAVAYKGLGYTYKNLGKYQLALDNFNKYLSGYHPFSRIEFHQVYIDIADLYLKLNDQENALNYYQESLEVAKYFRAKNEIATSNFKIGDYYHETNPRLAEKYYLSALEIANEAKNITLIKCIADTLSQYYLKKNDYRLVYYYQHLVRIMNDSINKSDRYANIADLEMELEIKKAKKENDAKQLLSIEEIRRQKIYRNFFLLITGLLVLLGMFQYINYKRKKKDNLLLTDQKNEISEKNQEIQAQIEEINRISKKLHEADQMKLRFFSNISHEIRTPLTLIINPLQNLIRSFKGDQEQKRQLDLIYNNADRLKELTDQILDLQKLDAGSLKLNQENADIVAHLKGIISSFEGYCSRTKCKLFFTSEFSSLYCSFDKDKITKIISNLLSNAFKYSHERGEIKVKLTVDDNRLILSVKDKGKGIPEEHLKDVFKRYYQLETSNIQPEGSGIGLAYVKELVELMKGKVEIKSEINKGTDVVISIPLTEYKIIDSSSYKTELKPTKQPAIENQLYDVPTNENDHENIRSILIVEDNDDLRNFMGDLFKVEFQIIYAKNGEEGIKNAFHHLPDIIISDIIMPFMDGIEMCSILKQDEQTSHIPVILLTAKDNFESHIEGYQSGADDYIVKPFDSTLLKLKVQNIISTRESARKQFDLEKGTYSNSLIYSDIDKSFLNKCIDIINKHIDNPDFNVDNLSDELSFSRRNLYRKLQALTDYNPAELIRNIRMQHAANLLKSTDLRVFEIALAVGYDNTVYFSQTFKKQFGVLPSEYINKN